MSQSIYLIHSLIIVLLTSCNYNEKKYARNYLDYYEIIHQANYQAFKQNISKADSLYQTAFRKVEYPFYRDYLKAAENIKSEDQLVFEYLHKAMKAGLDTSKISSNENFKKFKQSILWIKLKKQYPKIRKRYLKNLNKELISELKCMVDMDQYPRQNTNETELTMAEVDKRNLELLLHLINLNGFPGRFSIGEEIAEKFIIMFHHFHPNDNQKYFYMPLMKKMINGEIYPYRNAAFRDYDRIKTGKYQIYGTYHTYNKGVKTLSTVERFDNLDILRKQMGLEPIESFLEKNEIIYDPYFDDKCYEY